jgi:hypothetical protein
VGKAIGAVIALIVVAAGGFALLVGNINTVVRTGIETRAPEVLGVPVTVDEVDISLTSGDGSIRGLTIFNPEGYDSASAIVIDELRIALDPWSLSGDTIHISEILVDSASIIYEGDLLSSNLQALQKNASGPEDSGNDEAGSAGAASTTPALVVDRISVTNTNLAAHLPLLKAPLTLVVPTIEVTDLGKDEPATAGDIATSVLIALNKSVLPLITANSGSIKRQFDALTDQLGERKDELKSRAADLKERAKSLASDERISEVKEKGKQLEGKLKGLLGR